LGGDVKRHCEVTGHRVVPPTDPAWIRLLQCSEPEPLSVDPLETTLMKDRLQGSGAFGRLFGLVRRFGATEVLLP
jgi:hypothetical protein